MHPFVGQCKESTILDLPGKDFWNVFTKGKPVSKRKNEKKSLTHMFPLQEQMLEEECLQNWVKEKKRDSITLFQTIFLLLRGDEVSDFQDLKNILLGLFLCSV